MLVTISVALPFSGSLVPHIDPPSGPSCPRVAIWDDFWGCFGIAWSSFWRQWATFSMFRTSKRLRAGIQNEARLFWSLWGSAQGEPPGCEGFNFLPASLCPCVQESLCLCVSMYLRLCVSVSVCYPVANRFHPKARKQINKKHYLSH